MACFEEKDAYYGTRILLGQGKNGKFCIKLQQFTQVYSLWLREKNDLAIPRMAKIRVMEGIRQILYQMN